MKAWSIIREGTIVIACAGLAMCAWEIARAHRMMNRWARERG